MSNAPFSADIIVVGGTGDLAMRKLLPALRHRDRAGQLADDSRIIAVSRAGLDHDGYRDKVSAELAGNSDDPLDTTDHRFLRRLHHVTIDATGSEDWDALVDLLGPPDHRIRVLYLACAPTLFGSVCTGAQRNGLLDERARVVLEKPLGHDLASAQRINGEVGAVFTEEQIFRIDHYLGKETVQNLLVLRFANSLFEPLWNAAGIDHVQISVAESVGAGSRAGYYDESGALRDMIQNHLLQLLCLVAMEPPATLDREAVRDEKLKVLRALAPITGEDVHRHTVRGQYVAGAIHGQPVEGYRAELDRTRGPDGPPTASRTETFVALRTEVRNWRWAGVPFYLRTGKRMDRRASEIVVQFRPVPHSMFPQLDEQAPPNRLVLRLQPDEGVRLHLAAKLPGPGGIRLHPAALDLSFATTFGRRLPDAYERLLMDVLRGNPTLFMRRDEIEAAWSWVEPILNGWGRSRHGPRPYPAGTSGPASATALIERDGRTWHGDEDD
ncbi:glucose-6-phosphate dehydrogenase [Pseudonocardia oroxyli]|uniref:Glucose-6-phosphate 1-dehydrogenase n=1 Tax=Pseudonocardia oroxyli TaxID=366584 RepID=A0A1G7SVD5_PSEOR|nr:glucose-6-phosphate dehydrogenase [Pseudonocardia oroxyli]SDG26754.1 glucose-6-phosphate 1-dehydrogenase [Pseudonocardia oroxyli]